jgi:hypothetical protein
MLPEQVEALLAVKFGPREYTDGQAEFMEHVVRNREPLPVPALPVEDGPRLRVRCPECEGWDAAKIDCPHRCGVRMEAR